MCWCVLVHKGVDWLREAPSRLSATGHRRYSISKKRSLRIHRSDHITMVWLTCGSSKDRTSTLAVVPSDSGNSTSILSYGVDHKH